MHEVFPVAAGLLVGALAYRVSSPRLRALVMAVLSVLLGVAATFISGEALISWGFVLIDIPLVLGASVIGFGLLVLWQRWSTQPR